MSQKPECRPVRRQVAVDARQVGPPLTYVVKVRPKEGGVHGRVERECTLQREEGGTDQGFRELKHQVKNFLLYKINWVI